MKINYHFKGTKRDTGQKVYCRRSVNKYGLVVGCVFFWQKLSEIVIPTVECNLRNVTNLVSVFRLQEQRLFLKVVLGYTDSKLAMNQHTN